MFLSIEGGDGAGKSTLIRRLKEQLEKEGKEVLLTREPGGSPLGEKIRSQLLDHDSSVNIGAKAELLLFLASRVQHIEETIKPALAAGKVVICDRFNDSSIAYQGYGRQMGADFVSSLCHQACNGFNPDLTLYLDVEVAVGQERRGGSGEGDDRIESEKADFHERVRGGYRELAKQDPERFHIIDAHGSPDEVFEEALKIIGPKLR